MKILVVSRQFVERKIQVCPDWCAGKWIISIFSHFDSNLNYSPCPDRYNILKLQFDDVTEKDNVGIKFSENHAKKLLDFIKAIKSDSDMPFYIHCDAGVSRSGAVGYMLNEWFNKYIETNREDNEFFIQNNRHIMPNPLVVRILKNEFFGNDYSGVFVNDYTYNENGEQIDNITEV